MQVFPHCWYVYVLPFIYASPSFIIFVLLGNTNTSSKASGPGSVVSIATGYVLDGPGIESRWGRDFPQLSRPALGPNQPPILWVPGLSRGYRASGA